VLTEKGKVVTGKRGEQGALNQEGKIKFREGKLKGSRTGRGGLGKN